MQKIILALLLVSTNTLAMDLYVDSKTKQIYAEPGPNRVLMGSFEKVSSEPVATKSEVKAIREELDTETKRIRQE